GAAETGEGEGGGGSARRGGTVGPRGAGSRCDERGGPRNPARGAAGAEEGRRGRQDRGMVQVAWRAAGVTPAGVNPAARQTYYTRLWRGGAGARPTAAPPPPPPRRPPPPAHPPPPPPPPRSP